MAHLKTNFCVAEVALTPWRYYVAKNGHFCTGKQLLRAQTVKPSASNALCEWVFSHVTLK